MARKSATLVELMVVCAILFIVGSIVFNGCGRASSPPTSGSTSAPEESVADREARELTARLQSRLTPPAGTVWKDGRAVVGRRAVSCTPLRRAPPQIEAHSGGDRPGRALPPTPPAIPASGARRSEFRRARGAPPRAR